MLFFDFTEALQAQMCTKFQQFKHPDLVKLTKKIPDFVSRMKQPNTIYTYTKVYQKFERWMLKTGELPSYPTTEHAVALYLMNLVEHQRSLSTLKAFLSSVKWIHVLGGYASPTDSQLVDIFMDSASKQIPTQVKHKRPVTKEMLQLLHNDLVNENASMSLHNMRDFVYILISFLGFLRFSEASSLRRQDVCLNYDFVRLIIRQSKTDPTAKGQDVFIARTSTDLCGLTWLVRYLKMSEIDDRDNCYIFRAIYHNVSSNKTGLRASDRKLSYTTLREMFKARLAKVGYKATNLSLHSLRAGGVTLAVEQGCTREVVQTARKVGF